MKQLDVIEQKVDNLTRIMQQLIDALSNDDVDEDVVIDLSGSTSRARDESQPL